MVKSNCNPSLNSLEITAKMTCQGFEGKYLICYFVRYQQNVIVNIFENKLYFSNLLNGSYEKNIYLFFVASFSVNISSQI